MCWVSAARQTGTRESTRQIDRPGPDFLVSDCVREMSAYGVEVQPGFPTGRVVQAVRQGFKFTDAEWKVRVRRNRQFGDIVVVIRPRVGSHQVCE